MNDEAPAAGLRNGANEVPQGRPLLLIVDADPRLDRDGDADSCRHCGDAAGHESRLGHQAGAETARLHPVAGTDDVEVDLVVAERLDDTRAFRKLARSGPAELQGYGMLRRTDGEQAVAVAAQHGSGGEHLRIEPPMPTDQPPEIAAWAVGPFHTRRDRK